MTGTMPVLVLLAFLDENRHYRFLGNKTVSIFLPTLARADKNLCRGVRVLPTVQSKSQYMSIPMEREIGLTFLGFKFFNDFASFVRLSFDECHTINDLRRFQVRGGVSHALRLRRVLRRKQNR